MAFGVDGLRGRIAVALGLSPLLMGTLAGCSGRTLDGPDTLGRGDSGDSGEATDEDDDGATMTTTATTASTAEGSDDAPPPLMCLGSDNWLEWELVRPPNAAGECVCDEECQNQAQLEWDDANCCSSCWYTFGEVLCSEPLADQCHYIITMYEEGCGKGRPLFVADQARTAAPQARGDWAMTGIAPSVERLSAEARRFLADYWTDAALAEHASVASFARFVLDLSAVGASPELLADASTAMHDEIRHARIAFALAGAYGGTAVGPGPISLQGVTTGQDAEAIVRAAVREGCVEETIAAAEADLAARRATDPAVRSALAEIAEDEARHAVLAWRFVDWAVRRDAAMAAVVREELGRALASADAAASVYEAELPIDDDVASAHGVLPPSVRARLRARCLEHTVAPCARAMIEPAGSSTATA